MAKSDKGLEVTAGRTKVIVPNRGMRIKRDIEKGNLQSAYAVGTFDEAKAFLESKGYRIISFEEQAGLRVQEGVDSSISTRGN
ncbi:MAG TPA: hypothetical protein VI544_01080, partial [Candidatus Nanoarchaeia archaeon]|nr:hypothetical protein [Candidatus Nanoarchaeia archaeon]